MVSLFKELPYVAVVSDSRLSSICSKCFKAGPVNIALNHCAACKVIRYCSRECQMADWIDHKLECQLLKRISPEVPRVLVRFVARVVLKVRRGDFGSSFNGRTFKDLIDHGELIVKDAKQNLCYMAIRALLKVYLKDYLPSDEELLAIYAKISCNAITIAPIEYGEIGQGLYLGFSVHDHRCIPDVFASFDGCTLEMRGKAGVKYSTQLMVSYAGIFEITTERRKFLRDQFFFDCNCSVCNDVERQGFELSVRSECCEDSVCLVGENYEKLICHKCGSANKTTVAEALDLNDELKTLQARFEKGVARNAPGVDDYFRDAEETYTRFAKVLSPLNLRLAHFGKKLTERAGELKRMDIAQKYATVWLEAYRKYVPADHESRPIGLLTAALCISNSDNNEAMKLYKEAYKCALLSHGPNRPVSDSALRRLNECRKRG